MTPTEITEAIKAMAAAISANVDSAVGGAVAHNTFTTVERLNTMIVELMCEYNMTEKD